MDRMFKDLNKTTNRQSVESVHLSHFPESNSGIIDRDLEQRMDIAKRMTSLVQALRKSEKIKVRQPLQKIMVPIIDSTFERQLHDVENIILSEVNVKELEYLHDSAEVLVKEIKPDFKKLGPKFGKEMKALAAQINGFNQEQIAELEREAKIQLLLGDREVEITSEDVTISAKDIPGWLVAADGNITVALDITLTKELKEEGIAREFVNRIQNLRKDSGLEVTDKIRLTIERTDAIGQAIENNLDYICAETLAGSLDLVSQIEGDGATHVEVDGNISTKIALKKI